MRKTFIIVAAVAAVSMWGCKKDEKKGAEPDTTKTANPCGAKTANPCGAKTNPCANPCGAKANPCANPCAAKSVMPADAKANYAVAKISHAEPKPDDPVMVVWDKVDVKSAKFDPKNLEGGTAEITIGLASLKSGAGKRDGHLKSADFFDVENNAAATVKISGVKKDGDNYKASAEISVGGVTQKWPVSFEVVEAMDNWVRVKGTHKFKKSDFKIGVDVKGPADDVELELQVTLKAG